MGHSYIYKRNIISHLKTFKQWEEDAKIEKTTNKIENYFRITYPKADKRKERIKRGIEIKINHRIQKWFRNNSKIPKNNKVLDKAYLNTIQNIFKAYFIDLLLSLFLLKFIFF